MTVPFEQPNHAMGQLERARLAIVRAHPWRFMARHQGRATPLPQFPGLVFRLVELRYAINALEDAGFSSALAVELDANLTYRFELARAEDLAGKL